MTFSQSWSLPLIKPSPSCRKYHTPAAMTPPQHVLHAASKNRRILEAVLRNPAALKAAMTDPAVRLCASGDLINRPLSRWEHHADLLLRGRLPPSCSMIWVLVRVSSSCLRCPSSACSDVLHKHAQTNQVIRAAQHDPGVAETLRRYVAAPDS